MRGCAVVRAIPIFDRKVPMYAVWSWVHCALVKEVTASGRIVDCWAPHDAKSCVHLCARKGGFREIECPNARLCKSMVKFVVKSPIGGCMNNGRSTRWYSVREIGAGGAIIKIYFVYFVCSHFVKRI